MSPPDIDPIDAHPDRAAQAARFADLTRMRQAELDSPHDSPGDSSAGSASGDFDPEPAQNLGAGVPAD